MQKKVAYAVLFFVIFNLLLISANAIPGTCKNPNGGNYCGQHSGVSSCYCDDVCVSYNDCCDDYKTICATSKPVPPPCPKIACAAPPPDCHYENAVDSNGCQICGKLVCDNQKEIEVKVPSSFSLNEGQTAHVVNYQDIRIKLNQISTLPGPKIAVVTISSPSGCGPNTDQECLGSPGFSQDYKIQQGQTIDILGLKITFDGVQYFEKPPNTGILAIFKIATSSVCGNGICEEGEATFCPECTKANPPCKVACKLGTCPQDCQQKCPKIYKPVCGIDGKTYSNSCEAENAGVKIQCETECPCKTQITKQDVINWIDSNCNNPITYPVAGTGAVIKKAPIIIP